MNKPTATQTTTAEATVTALVRHGIDTIYALPGIHNDDLFDALVRAAARIRTIHTRHEQGAAYMALGAALATDRPQVYAVVPGPGLLNTGAALLTAYGMNAPVLALIGQIPDADIGRGFGHLHEIRDQAGIIARLVDFSARLAGPEDAAARVSEAIAAMRHGRPGPSVLECPIDVWGRAGPARPIPSATPPPARAADIDEVRKAANVLGGAERVMIVCGGGAQGASAEIAELSTMLQAPVLGYRRGRGVLSSRDPFSVTLPLGRELWGEADAVLAVGTRLEQLRGWGCDDGLNIVRVDADPEQPARAEPPAAALVGDAQPLLAALAAEIPSHNRKRAPRRDEMIERQGKWARRLDKLAPQRAIVNAIRAELPDEGIFVDEVTQIGFAARLMLPVYRPRTFLSPGYQDNLGWGFATALGAQDARRDVPVLSISGDGGFLYTANELASAVRHRIPLVTVVFVDGAFGNVRRIQEERFGNRLIACDLANPDFVRFAESFGVAAERAGNPAELRGALRRGFSRRDGPTLIEMPVGAFPSPWEFILMPRVRGRKVGNETVR